MTTYYCGPGGNDASNGLTWGTRKLTLTGCEDVPVAAGDTVYVGAGVYRETLTLDVSGAAGSPITYIGDVTGEHTDGIGGTVRITGSDDDQTATRANCITCGAQRNYRTFRGFTMDTTTAVVFYSGLDVGGTNWIVEDCSFVQHVANQHALQLRGASIAAWTVRRCLFSCTGGSTGIDVYHAADLSDCGIVIENCVFTGALGAGVQVRNVGGIIVRDCAFINCYCGVRVAAALAGGQTVTVNGCIFTGIGANAGVNATVLGELVENYNTFWGNTADRINVNVGANSVAYPPLFDSGILHSGAGQVSGFRFPQPQFGALSQWSQVRAIADGGTNATLDITGLMRPPTDGKRSWGAVQYQNVGREATTTHGGSLALRFDDYGRRQFYVPCSNVATTVSVYCYREADYAGTNPTMIIKQPGVADRVTTDVGAAGGWNQLTDTFTPAAQPGWFTVELCSLNTDAANAPTNDAFFDDLTVSVNSSLGTMETWLWDTEVSDWVAYAGGGACDYPAEGDVEAGVVYGSGAYTGTLVCGKRCARFPDMELCKRRGLS